MSPERAKVIIIDDHRLYIDSLSESLRQEGHHVQGTATSVVEGEKLIDATEELDVALIDGNLDQFSAGGEDGEGLARRVREKFPEAKVISISREIKKWSDSQIVKTVGSSAVAEEVTRI